MSRVSSKIITRILLRVFAPTSPNIGDLVRGKPKNSGGIGVGSFTAKNE